MDVNRDVQAIARQASSRESRFSPIWLDDAKPDLNTSYLVKGVIDQGDVGVLFGAPGCGKTFFAVDFAGHIACGMEWRGKRVRQASVVYVAAEAGAKIARRFNAWREKNVGEAHEGRVPLVILTKGANLLNSSDLALLLEELRAIAEEAGTVGLVIFDTLSRSMPGGKENAPEDMSRIIHAATTIREELGAATLFVHHTGKDETRGLRGHSCLHGAVDTEIEVSNRTATIKKSRDGASGEEFPFDLDVVELGADEDGDMLTTCVVRPVAGSGIVRRPPAKLTGSETVCLDALREAASAEGQTLPGTSTIPAGARGVHIKKWREVFYRKYGDEHSREAAKKAFNRALPNLQSKGQLGVSDPWAWLC